MPEQTILPDPIEATTAREVLAHLTDMEAARQHQLDALPPTDVDAVAAAHRATVERILAEVRLARQRIAAGLYGVCAGCRGEIPVQRLELRPWATRCARCAAHKRS